MDLIPRLEEAGLSTRQAQIYVTLLRLGSAGPAEIARQASVKRPTAYEALEELCTRSLATRSVVGRSRSYTAAPPARLLDEAAERQRRLKDLLPDLQSLIASATTSRPRLIYREGAEGIRQVHEDLLTAREKEYRYFGGSSEMVGAMGEDYLKDYVRRRVAKGIRSLSIRWKSQEVALPCLADGERWLRRTRYLDISPADGLSGLFIYDQRIAVISSYRESYGMVLESDGMSRLLRMVWEAMWAVARAP
jgi:HTH-type transcriptional regulator, sugar sensing transcriptional regulator